MKNIHSINFIKHTTLLACSALLAVSLAACSQPVASDAASTAGSASSNATSDTAQIPNPWTGCTTLADAAALTGYDFTVPDSVDGYPDVTIAVLESEQLTEVQYSSGNARLCLRKATGSDDISGDFNQYAESNAVAAAVRAIKRLPFNFKASRNIGIFNARFVSQIGIPPSVNPIVTCFTIIPIPVNPPVTNPLGSYIH